MNQTRFHARFATDLDVEIQVGENLYIGSRLRWGERLASLVRRNPAAVFRRLHYFRGNVLVGDGGAKRRAVLVEGVRWDDTSKPTNAEILTPSLVRWVEFRDRLSAELASPDADWRFAPANRCRCGSFGAEFWPLASAQLLERMGFAVAESLAVFLTFHANTDQDVLDHVERIWWRVRPWRRRSHRQTRKARG